jgi:hypothetical protein
MIYISLYIDDECLNLRESYWRGLFGLLLKQHRVTPQILTSTHACILLGSLRQGFVQYNYTV